MIDKLTTKQRLFVEAYLVTSNATESARRAGYKGNDNTLCATGSRLLRNVKVNTLTEKRVTKAAMTADEWMAEVAQLARQAEKESDRLTAYSLIGKPLNLTNNTRTDVNATVEVTTRTIEPGDE